MKITIVDNRESVLEKIDEISEEFVNTLTNKLNYDLSESIYYASRDNEIGVYINDSSLLLDIGVNLEDGLYSYYFKNMLTKEELTADDQDVYSLGEDILIEKFNKIKVTS